MTHNRKVCFLLPLLSARVKSFTTSIAVLKMKVLTTGSAEPSLQELGVVVRRENQVYSTGELNSETGPSN